MTTEQPEHDREHDHPAAEQVTEHVRARPVWTAAEAARRCNVGRATIQRALKAGKIPGAENSADGWKIPLEGLLAAGFFPDRPAPPDEQPQTVDTPSSPQGDREHDRAPSEHVTGHDREHARLAELERDLAAAQARADLEHAHRVAAEQLAAERAQRIGDLQTALRMLEPPRPAEPQPTAPPKENSPAGPTTVAPYSGPATPPAAEQPAPAPETPPAAPERPATRRGRFFAWLRG